MKNEPTVAELLQTQAVDVVQSDELPEGQELVDVRLDPRSGALAVARPVIVKMREGALRKEGRELLAASLEISATELALCIADQVADDEITPNDLNVLTNALSNLQRSFVNNEGSSGGAVVQITNQIAQFRDRLTS